METLSSPQIKLLTSLGPMSHILAYVGTFSKGKRFMNSLWKDTRKLWRSNRDMFCMNFQDFKIICIELVYLNFKSCIIFLCINYIIYLVEMYITSKFKSKKLWLIFRSCWWAKWTNKNIQDWCNHYYFNSKIKLH